MLPLACTREQWDQEGLKVRKKEKKQQGTRSGLWEAHVQVPGQSLPFMVQHISFLRSSNFFRTVLLQQVHVLFQCHWKTGGGICEGEELGEDGVAY